MVIAMLSVMKAGKAYLAIHPGLPLTAQTDIVQDVAPILMLATTARASRAREIAAGCCHVLTLDDIGDDASASNPDPRCRPEDPSTIFYTSGTTGQSKAVFRNHRFVMHRAWLSSVHDAFTTADRQSLLTHCSFAASQTDFPALLQGATLCVFDVATEGLAAFRTWIEDEQITVLRSPTLLFRRFLASLEDGQVFPSVRLVVVGGDTVTVADLEQWKRHFPRPCVAANRFSATEATLLTEARIDHDTVLTTESIAAGIPVADKELTLVDEQGQMVATGDTGELVVTSHYLSDGYWRRPEETARKFTSDPQVPGRRSYQTGDLGRFLPDGRFVFLGRRDHQVKIRGYRVEIAEVEATLRAFDDVSEAAVVAVKEGDDQRLLAFIVTADGAAFDAVSMRRRLSAVLPEWKVPAQFYPMPSLPTTLGAKVDRQRLAAHARELEASPVAATPSADFTPPADALEREIAALCEQLLHRRQVGRSDDFFLLGGNSLQATVLHLHLERLIEKTIPLETLFEQPTIAGMARVVSQVRLAEPAAPRVLIPLRRTGAQPALFLVHGRLGQAFVSPYLLEVLGRDQPVYAFQASGLDRSRMPRNTVEEIADQYVGAMRQIQGAGPYFIGGLCAGSVVAVAMVNQLRRSGEKVAPLLLIDPSNPAGEYPWWSRWGRLAQGRLGRRIPWLSTNHRLSRTLRRRAMQGRVLDPGEGMSLQIAADAALDLRMALLKCTRWRFDGPTLVLRSRERLLRDGPQRDGPFSSRLSGDVQWFDVGATHRDVHEANNELLARHLRHCVGIVRDAIAGMSDKEGPRVGTRPTWDTIAGSAAD